MVHIATIFADECTESGGSNDSLKELQPQQVHKMLDQIPVHLVHKNHQFKRNLKQYLLILDLLQQILKHKAQVINDKLWDDQSNPEPKILFILLTNKQNLMKIQV